MGIYDKLIHCVNHFFKELKQNVLFLFPIAIGVVIALIASVFGMDYLFETFPLQANLLFIGLILGGLPDIYEKVKGVTVRFSYVFCFVLLFGFVIAMAFFNDAQGGEVVIGAGAWDLIKLFLIGVVAAATMVIPGVSGSMILLLLGYYNPLLDAIKSFMEAILKWNMEAMLKGMILLAPFGIGVIVGIVLISRLMEFVFETYPLYAYWSIIGLLLASPIAILMVGTFQNITILSVVVGIFLFGIGFFIARKLNK